MTNFRRYQDDLVDLIKTKYRGTEAISKRAIEAFYRVPRHLFVHRYRVLQTDQWLRVNGKNLNDHLAAIYGDFPLILWGSESEFRRHEGSTALSTISQPSFVLRILDLLELQPGQNVLEIGAGSGWNAALMGELVGPQGSVISVEIVPQLVRQAKRNIEKLGLSNVTIVCVDGNEGYQGSAPYDRVVFTAAADAFPEAIYEQTKENGIVLYVEENDSGDDSLLVLKKHGEHFVCSYIYDCSFVPLISKEPRVKKHSDRIPADLTRGFGKNSS